MNLLLISNEDSCRSRIAQEILYSFGRGMKIATAGIGAGSNVPDMVYNAMERNGYTLSRKKPSGIETYKNQAWDYVITLCQEAENEVEFLMLDAKQQVHFHFDDVLKTNFQPESEQEQQITALYESMRHRLYEFYRDELSEQLLPRCTCGANTYCRCE